MRKIALFAVVGAILTGCGSEPTREPDAKTINDAVANKYKAIDNDPSMNAEQKAELKKHIAGPVGDGQKTGR